MDILPSQRPLLTRVHWGDLALPLLELLSIGCFLVVLNDHISIGFVQAKSNLHALARVRVRDVDLPIEVLLFEETFRLLFLARCRVTISSTPLVHLHKLAIVFVASLRHIVSTCSGWTANHHLMLTAAILRSD